jgi:hypothetical protein
VVEDISFLATKGRFMNTTTISSRLVLPNQAFLFDLDALYVQLQRVKDRRKRRGVRYPLAEILMIALLAK